MANEKTFEQQMMRLEEIVRLLEKGDAPLEDSLSLFEEGVKLSGVLTRQLDEAQLKVVKLQKGSDGSPIEQDFLEEEG